MFSSSLPPPADRQSHCTSARWSDRWSRSHQRWTVWAAHPLLRASLWSTGSAAGPWTAPSLSWEPSPCRSGACTWPPPSQPRSPWLSFHSTEVGWRTEVNKNSIQFRFLNACLQSWAAAGSSLALPAVLTHSSHPGWSPPREAERGRNQTRRQKIRRDFLRIRFRRRTYSPDTVAIVLVRCRYGSSAIQLLLPPHCGVA